MRCLLCCLRLQYFRRQSAADQRTFDGHRPFLPDSYAVITLARKGRKSCYSAPSRGAKYCDERICVCVSVCLSLSVEHISKTRCSNFTKFRRVLSVTVVVCSDGVAINQSINQSVQCVMYFGCRGIRHFVPEIGQVKAAVAARILKVTHQGAAPVRRQSWCLRLPCRWNVSYVGLENSSNAICWHRVAVWSYTGL